MISFLQAGNRRTLFFAVFLLLSAASWQSPFAGAAPARDAGRVGARRTAQRAAGTDSPVPVFEFHSGFWVNLHHFLYLQARLIQGNSAAVDSGIGAAPLREAPASLIDLSAAEIRTWQVAVAFYAKDLATRDLQLNGDMENINNRLSELETCADLAGKSSKACTSGLEPGLVQALDSAEPIYRAHWWAGHDRANREWIGQVAPMVQQMGVQLAQQLANVYKTAWPSGKLRVDVVWYGGPYGAYTSLNPIHVIISSHDVRNQNAYGFEVLFHESSHALAGSLNEAISREFRQRDKPIPRDLWQALSFYTTGELVRRDLALGTITLASQQGTDLSDYSPYAERFGLYSGPWERFRSLLDLYWRPYLDENVSFDTAIARLASAE